MVFGNSRPAANAPPDKRLAIASTDRVCLMNVLHACCACPFKRTVGQGADAFRKTMSIPTKEAIYQMTIKKSRRSFAGDLSGSQIRTGKDYRLFSRYSAQ